MNPEHKLLKFIIVPLILAVFGVFVFWHFNQGKQWNEIGPFYIDDYQGDRTFSITNIQDYLNKNWNGSNLKYVVSMWHEGKTYFFNKQTDDDNQEINSQSIFRVASVSKVFTSIAILQLVEKGKLSLDDKVEKYVSYRKNFKEQPTVGQLLLHTAGFDNNNTSFFYHLRDEKPTMKDFLYRQELVQAIEPGIVFDYTNTAFDIAGYIIEKVSGQRFEDYCKENIFKQLGMDKTSFDEPESYVLGKDGKGEVVENYYVGGRASGGLLSTSEDMGRFLECMMRNGRLGKTQVFSPRLMDMIYEKKFEIDPLPLKKTPVFWIDSLGNRKCFGQMGKILGFSSHIVILPGEVAIFCTSANQNAGQQIGWSLLNTFFSGKTDDKSLSVVFYKDDQGSLKGVKENIENFSGRWINMFGWNRGNVAKLANVVAYNLDLEVKDGVLWINDVQMERVDDLTFRSDDWHVKFVRGEKGDVKYLQTGQDAHVRSSWYNDSKIVIPYLIVTFALFVLGALQFVFGLLMRFWGRVKPSKDESILWWSMFGVSLSHLCLATVLWFTLAKIDIYRLGFRTGTAWYALFSLPIIAMAGTFLVLVMLARAIKERKLGWLQIINALIFAVVQAVFAGFLAFWNFMGFRF